MADRITKEQRSKVMGSIKAQSKLENMVSKELWKRGFRFRKNNRKLKGTPDIAIKKYKVVIFIDSCFWHYCGEHGTVPKSNRKFWIRKFKKNKLRDINVNEYYKEKGWNILRVWEHELKQDFHGTIDNIISFINSAKEKTL